MPQNSPRLCVVEGLALHHGQARVGVVVQVCVWVLVFWVFLGGIMNGNVCGFRKLQTGILQVRLSEMLQGRILKCSSVKSQFLPSFGLTCVPSSNHKWNERIISLFSGALDQCTWSFSPSWAEGEFQPGAFPSAALVLHCCAPQDFQGKDGKEKGLVEQEQHCIIKWDWSVEWHTRKIHSMVPLSAAKWLRVRNSFPSWETRVIPRVLSSFGVPGTSTGFYFYSA